MYSEPAHLRFGYLVQDLTTAIKLDHPDILQRIHGIIHHPRSLARPLASWRPAVCDLPGNDAVSELRVAISRRRVGPQAIAFLANYDTHAAPAAYVITLRITQPEGKALPRRRAEAWVRALLGSDTHHCVHFVESPSSMTFFWLVDANFRPLASPAAMFADAPLAA
ncbi:MAG: hypothetical protein Q3976_01085 [Corynebacterium sp.]|nr:hypothetical protein [Corynebacterium sp.]